MWPLTALAHMDPGWFGTGTRKERPCFAAECRPDPFGHTRALEGQFFDPGSEGQEFRAWEGG